MIIRSERVDVRTIQGKGRGVFSREPVRAGMVICTAPTLELPDWERIEQTSLGSFYFGHPVDDNAGMLVFGWISLLNHADPANSTVEWEQTEQGWLAALRAIRDIGVGDELTYQYRCGLWFDPVR